MISKNDLYDVTFALTTIRNDIQNESNKKILLKIISVFDVREDVLEDNQIRKALSTIDKLDKEHWYYIYHNNIYVNHQFLKNNHIYELLKKMCKELNGLLEDNNFERAYDLADTFHCLPDIIADNNFTIPKSFWKNYIKPYSDKWDKNFLIEERRKILWYKK